MRNWIEAGRKKRIGEGWAEWSHDHQSSQSSFHFSIPSYPQFSPIQNSPITPFSQPITNHSSPNSLLKYPSSAKLPCTLSREKVSISLDKDEKRDYPFHSHEVNVLFFGTYNHFLTQPPFLDPSCDHLPCKSPISKHHPSDPIYTHILFFPPQRILSIHQESRESQNPNPKKQLISLTPIPRKSGIAKER